ncbi:MAG TPA: chemotaxis protein CheW [Bacillota bacterium]|nr:chemotaxis protein CheW [Bacillota bacterium]
MNTAESFCFWQDQQMVAFRIGSRNYAMEIRNIQEIVRSQKATRLPNSPGHVEGIINLRGSIIPTLNLHTLFGVPQTEITENSRLVIITVDDVRYGIMVDEASEVMRIPGTAVEATPEVGTGNQKDYIVGVAKFDEELWVILDPRALTEFFKSNVDEKGLN